MRVSFRLSLLQSTWFEGGMQSIGLTYCLIPGLRALYPDRDEMQRAIQRYEQPFNTHPFLVGFIAGALLKMEEEHQDPTDITCFSSNTMGALAAFGDPFFRSALPTFVASVACLTTLVGGAVAGIVTLLLLFNAVHFAIRVWGVSVGFREGCAVLVKVAHWFNQARTHRIKLVASIVMGMVLVAMTMTFGNVSADSFWLVITAAASCVTSGIILIRWSRLQQLAIPLVILILVLIEVAI